MKNRETGGSGIFLSILFLGTMGLMAAAFIGGTYVEQAIWALPDRVNFRQCLPWFAVFTAITMYFNSVFDLSRRKYHLIFSAFTSIVLVNILMMALPFFEVLYYVHVSTVFVIFVIEFVAVSGWILLTHRIWRKKNPPAPTILFCTDLQRGKEIRTKINAMRTTNRIDRVVVYTNDSFLGIVHKYPTIILDNPPAEIKSGIALYCWENKKELLIIPDVYDLVINNASLVQFDDLMVYRTRSIGLSPEQRFFKRVFDIAGSAAALLLLSPVILIVAILVRRDGGPAFYAQNRVTRGGRVFDLYKFRTMISDAEKQTGPVLAMKDDPRITKVGRKLRQMRLDEIPQLWNTLKGDMSLVGPRPEREHFIQLYKETIPEYEYRTMVRAGVTGLAHVLGKYNTTPEERIKLDLTYMQNYSFFLDMKIILETIRVVFTKEYAEGVDSEKTSDPTDRYPMDAGPTEFEPAVGEPIGKQPRRKEKV